MNKVATIDPRQTQAIQFYKDPASETFGDLKNSLIKAGFSEKYAMCLRAEKPKWITEYMQSNVDLIQKAEQNLRDYVELCLPLTSESNKTEVDIAKMKLDASKFILKNLASGKYKSAPEQGDTSSAITLNITNYNAPSTKPIEVIDITPE
jgi:hypothetical protein